MESGCRRIYTTLKEKDRSVMLFSQHSFFPGHLENDTVRSPMSCNGSRSSDQAGPYPYQVLDAEQRQIRVLTLLPGNWHDPISCELEVVSLNDDPAYFALSYVWGDPKVTLPIYLHKHALQVTSNLENALRRLRGPIKPMVIWIDALCMYSHRTTMNYFES